MKKFLATLTLALLIVIPTAFVEAADVPNFLSVVGNKATYTGGQRLRGDLYGDYNTYTYLCEDISLGEDLAIEYCNYLITHYPFRFDGGYENDYIRTSATKYTTALFTYTGSKRVSTFEREDHSEKVTYDCNLSVSTYARYQDGTIEITIRVAPELTYE